MSETLPEDPPGRAETVAEYFYITEEQRDLVLSLFGGVRLGQFTYLQSENARLREALTIAQSALAMLTEPKTIQSTNVREAWGIAVEAEMKCRSALAKASQTAGE